MNILFVLAVARSRSRRRTKRLMKKKRGNIILDKPLCFSRK